MLINNKDNKNLYPLLGHHFANADLLVRALTHCSAGSCHNERLEFLGDAILGLIISEALYESHEQETEGGLSQMRACLVNRETLATIARHKQIHTYLVLGPGARRNIPEEISESILSNAMEAIIGAIYIDASLEKSRSCVIQWYTEIGCHIGAMEPIKNPKSILQEWLQIKKYPLPEYETHETGLAHALDFTTLCSVRGLSYLAKGVGKSRREAEQRAASEYLKILYTDGAK